MKISIITVCWNSADTIKDAINSVLMQSYPDIEYIIVDGGSTDGTVQIIESFKDQIAKFVSEPDNGIYDAMNKGIKLCTGDVIGILNSDDFYASNDLIQKVFDGFPSSADMVFGDVLFVDRKAIHQHLRYIDGSAFKPWKLRFGWMPPHPACFIRSHVYSNFGLYKTEYKIAADYEFFVRILFVKKVRATHNPEIMISMREGGVSTKNLKSTIVISWEILKACKQNNMYSNSVFIWSRLPIKYIQQKLFSFSAKFSKSPRN